MTAVKNKTLKKKQKKRIKHVKNAASIRNYNKWSTVLWRYDSVIFIWVYRMLYIVCCFFKNLLCALVVVSICCTSVFVCQCEEHLSFVVALCGDFNAFVVVRLSAHINSNQGLQHNMQMMIFRYNLKKSECFFFSICH